jgi:hypothetical protein
MVETRNFGRRTVRRSPFENTVRVCYVFRTIQHSLEGKILCSTAAFSPSGHRTIAVDSEGDTST